MPKITEDLVQFLRLGEMLKKSIASETREAADRGWEPQLVTEIRDAAGKYFAIAARFARYLGITVFIPFVFAVRDLVRNQPNGGIGMGYAVWMAIVGLVAIWLFFPLFLIVPPLRRLPEAVYRELLRPLWINIEILYILISAGLFAYIYPSWTVSTTLPIWTLVVLLWLFAPWIVYLAKRDRIFITLRLGQLGVLLVGTFLLIASPVPMKHFQWWAERKVANKIRPAEQKEITSNWATLQWFTQEGAPNVWYSSSAGHGYRLFAAPGHDGDTNEDLKPVLDKETRDIIVAALNEQKGAEEERVASETQRKLGEIAAQDEKRNAEIRDKLIREYVFPSAVKDAASDRPVVLIVLNDRQRQDSALTERISQLLSAAGLQHETVVFTPTFIASSVFQEMLTGRRSLGQLFHAENFASHLLVIQTTATISKQVPVNGVEMLAADTIWSVLLISSSDYRIEDSEEIKVRGIGFKEADATEMAIKRATSEMQKRLLIIGAKLAPPK